MLGGFSLTFRYFVRLANFATESKKYILYIGSFVLGSIVEKLSNESFLAVVGNVVKDLVDGNQEDLNVLAVIGTVVEYLVNGNQDDVDKWFKCNNGDVMTSFTKTFDDKKFDQEDTIKTGDNNNADDLTCSFFSNLPLPFSGVTFFGIEGLPFFQCYLVVFLLAFGMILLFFYGCVHDDKSERTGRWQILQPDSFLGLQIQLTTKSLKKGNSNVCKIILF